MKLVRVLQLILSVQEPLKLIPLPRSLLSVLEPLKLVLISQLLRSDLEAMKQALMLQLLRLALEPLKQVPLPRSLLSVLEPLKSNLLRLYLWLCRLLLQGHDLRSDLDLPSVRSFPHHLRRRFPGLLEHQWLLKSRPPQLL